VQEVQEAEEADGDTAKLKKNKKKKKKKGPKKTREPDADTSQTQDDTEMGDTTDQTPVEEGDSADEAAAAPAEAGEDEATPEEPYNGVDMSGWIMFDLDPRLLRALAELGFTEPTPIQRECILPAVRDFRDILGAAETGSGKTLAFGLPVLQHILHRREKVIGGDL
jgi:ATP-dependent RNA helicase DDX24/MAK5